LLALGIRRPAAGEDAPPPWDCEAHAIAAAPEPAAAAQAQLRYVRVAGAAGFDRFVMEFTRHTGVPLHVVTKEDHASFEKFGGVDPDGGPLGGAAFVRVSLTGASGYKGDHEHPVFVGPRRLVPEGTSVVWEVAELVDHDGQLDWGIGVARRSCVRVFKLKDPPRLVVDVKH
jgi:hypothetical protein